MCELFDPWTQIAYLMPNIKNLRRKKATLGSQGASKTYDAVGIEDEDEKQNLVSASSRRSDGLGRTASNSITRSDSESLRKTTSALAAGFAQAKQENTMGDMGIWHLQDLTYCEDVLNTNCEQGLTQRSYQNIITAPGFKFNELTPPPSKSWLLKFLSHMGGMFPCLLWAASALCFIAYVLDNTQDSNLWLGFILAIVTFGTGCFSYYQDAKADAVMEGFTNMMPENINVIRNGNLPVTVPARELVVGDVVSLFSGKKVPADLRLITASNVQVDNSSLTGENLPQDRNAGISTYEQPLEATNILYYGTQLVNGKCTGVVLRTGDNTAMGNIATLVRDTSVHDTPIAIEIHHFIKIITYVALLLGVTFSIIGATKDMTLVDTVVFGIGIIVANVPEGLIATVTLALTLTSKRMSQKQVLVKNLEAVETLGSTTVIASDKTGTLTCNRMTVVNLFYDLQFKIAAVAASVDELDPSFASMVMCMTLCNNATFAPTRKNMDMPPKNRATMGDATESAMIKYAEEFWITRGTDIMDIRAIHTLVFEIPFNSTNKFALSIHKMSQPDFPYMVYMKGAPERILSRCDYVLDNGRKVKKTQEIEEKIKTGLRLLMMQGQRVLALAEASLPPLSEGEEYYYEPRQPEGKQTNFPFIANQGLVFCGLSALMDPPRAAVPSAVMTCRNAGIQVIMVTGDHPDTAEAISREVNIVTGLTPRKLAEMDGRGVNDVHLYRNDPRVTAVVCTGAQLAQMTDNEVDHLLDAKELVFARTSPAQKLRIVHALQNKRVLRRPGSPEIQIKHVVAVTGDGVNDSPALKAADIGIAMGVTGSDVARDSADMILMDDNFASIVKGVEEGRLIFDNLKKSIAYTLSSNIPEISPFLMFVILQLPLPLPTILILFIDLGTDMIPAISLAYEHTEANIMMKPPRDMNKDRLVTTKLISFAYLQIGVTQAVAGFFTYFTVLNDYGFDPAILPGLSDGFKSENIVRNGTDAWISFEGARYYLKECNIKDEAVCQIPEEALKHAQTAFFICIIIVQWADLVICKTRELSLCSQGMRNGWLNFGLFWETAIGALIVYVPALNTIMDTRPLHFLHWIPGMPFAALILTYDEVRKYLIRNTGKDNWLLRNTYY